MSSKKPVVLVIRDGWGRNPLGPDVAKEYGDATVLADTPFTDYLLANYPHSLLGASGEDVGLPDGQMGNSEVGHLNLGAGRVVFQDLCRVDNAIKDGSMGENSVLKTAFSQAAGSRLHLLGLVSDGGVHSHINHLVGIVKYAYEAGVRRFVDEGMPFAAARQEVVRGILGPECSALLSTPNNNLGVEYLRALDRLGSPIRPVTVRREGAPHDSLLAGAARPEFLSATQLRAFLERMVLTAPARTVNDGYVRSLLEELYPLPVVRALSLIHI